MSSLEDLSEVLIVLVSSVSDRTVLVPSVFDDASRATFRAALGCDELEWERSKAWAFEQSLGAVWYYAESNPVMSAMGRRTLARIVAATPR